MIVSPTVFPKTLLRAFLPTMIRTGPIALDRQTIFAGIALPFICIAVDLAIGGFLMAAAPAVLLTMALGTTIALLASAMSDLAPTMRSGTSGALAAGCIFAFIVSVPLFALAIMALAIGVPGLLHGRGAALYFVVLAPLGFAPMWTGIVLFRRLRLLDRGGSFGAAALLSAVGVVAIALAADMADRFWINSRVEMLSKSTLEQWPTALASLSSYPLCGRHRCESLVCEQMFREYGRDSENFSVTTAVPVEQAALLGEFFGRSSDIACMKSD